MIHVFLLFVYVGIGEDKRLTSNDMYFRSVDDCVYFAQRLHKRKAQTSLLIVCQSW